MSAVVEVREIFNISPEEDFVSAISTRVEMMMANPVSLAQL